MQGNFQDIPRRTSPFDAIRHVDEQGNEYWSARELYKLLGYSRWKNFRSRLLRLKKPVRIADMRLQIIFTSR